MTIESNESLQKLVDHATSYLKPEIQVESERDIHRQCDFYLVKWQPTQNKEFKLVSHVMVDGDMQDECMNMLIKNFDHWLEHAQRDAKLWQDLLLRRHNRWWKCLCRWIRSLPSKFRREEDED